MYRAKSWLDEGDGFLKSATSLRALWALKQRSIRLNKPNQIDKDWSALTGYPVASMLLIGYSVEMYLKAGLVKWLQGCSEENLAAAVRSYGHNYCKLAQDLQIPETIAPQNILNSLNSIVLSEGRYPAKPKNNEIGYIAVNRRTSLLWDRKNFRDLRRLAYHLREYVYRMDSDSSCPTWYVRRKLSGSGYIALRVGGHLPPRITVRPPNADLWTIVEIENYLRGLKYPLVDAYWEAFKIYLEDRSSNVRLIMRERG